MQKATLDIPRAAPPSSLSPGKEVCFSAVVLAMAELLIDAGLISKDELLTRAQDFAENPEKMKAADMAQAVSDALFFKVLDEQKKRQAADAAKQEEARQWQRAMIKGR